MNTNPIRLFNIYGEHCGTGFAGNVWDTSSVCPTLMTMGGGNRQPMILTRRRNTELKMALALDEQNGYIRTDGTVGTIVTDGSSPKHNNRVIEPKCILIIIEIFVS